MTVSEPIRAEDPAEARARLALLERELRSRTIAALRRVPIRPDCADAKSIRRLAGVDLDRITIEEIELLNMLAWRRRRALPPGLAPKLPPHDPIVRAMERAANG